MKKFVMAMLALCVPAGSGAQDAAQVKSPEKKLCRAGEMPTGSRLPAKRTCHTKMEWDQIDAANRADTDRAFLGRPQVPSGAR